jgi:hypothetical protein
MVKSTKCRLPKNQEVPQPLYLQVYRRAVLEGRTQREVAAELNIHQVKVCRICQRVARWIQSLDQATILASFAAQGAPPPPPREGAGEGRTPPKEEVSRFRQNVQKSINGCLRELISKFNESHMLSHVEIRVQFAPTRPRGKAENHESSSEPLVYSTPLDDGFSLHAENPREGRLSEVSSHDHE